MPLCARLVPRCRSAGKGLTSWLSFVMSNYEFCHFPIGILGQVWYLNVSIPDLCTLTNLKCIIMAYLELESFLGGGPQLPPPPPPIHLSYFSQQSPPHSCLVCLRHSEKMRRRSMAAPLCKCRRHCIKSFLQKANTFIKNSGIIRYHMIIT